jgi:hypothetical protein
LLAEYEEQKYSREAALNYLRAIRNSQSKRGRS